MYLGSSDLSPFPALGQGVGHNDPSGSLRSLQSMNKHSIWASSSTVWSKEINIYHVGFVLFSYLWVRSARWNVLLWYYFFVHIVMLWILEGDFEEIHLTLWREDNEVSDEAWKSTFNWVFHQSPCILHRLTLPLCYKVMIHHGSKVVGYNNFSPESCSLLGLSCTYFPLLTNCGSLQQPPLFIHQFGYVFQGSSTWLHSPLDFEVDFKFFGKPVEKAIDRFSILRGGLIEWLSYGFSL